MDTFIKILVSLFFTVLIIIICSVINNMKDNPPKQYNPNSISSCIWFFIAGIPITIASIFSIINKKFLGGIFLLTIGVFFIYIATKALIDYLHSKNKK